MCAARGKMLGSEWASKWDAVGRVPDRAWTRLHCSIRLSDSGSAVKTQKKQSGEIPLCPCGSEDLAPQGHSSHSDGACTLPTRAHRQYPDEKILPVFPHKCINFGAANRRSETLQPIFLDRHSILPLYINIKTHFFCPGLQRSVVVVLLSFTVSGRPLLLTWLFFCSFFGWRQKRKIQNTLTYHCERSWYSSQTHYLSVIGTKKCLFFLRLVL